MAARTLARLVFGHEGLSKRLENSRLVQNLARKLKAREWLNAALKRRPLRRHLAGSGVRYEIRTFESLAVEKMYFGHRIYADIFSTHRPQSFIDLGCNSGIFPCFLTHLNGGRPLRGLCLDANETQLKIGEAQALLNGWNDIHFRYGMVGSGKNLETESNFYLHPTSLGSSRFPYERIGHYTGWKKVKVPSLNVEEIWSQLFGAHTQFDCLKIDIEGSEKDLVLAEPRLIERARSILLEWHSWTTSCDEMIDLLDRRGFKMVNEIERKTHCGTLYFQRR